MTNDDKFLFAALARRVSLVTAESPHSQARFRPTQVMMVMMMMMMMMILTMMTTMTMMMLLMVTTSMRKKMIVMMVMMVSKTMNSIQHLSLL